MLFHISTKSLLVTARAGSGKTTLLGLSVVTLIENLDVAPEEILALAFNREAARQIGERINDDYFEAPVFDNYATFHSFSRALAPPLENEKLLEEGDTRLLLRSVFNEVISENPKLSEAIYELFRKEMAEFERKELHLSDEEFYNIKRAETDFTLDGRYEVKSRGESGLLIFCSNIIFDTFMKSQFGTEILTQIFIPTSKSRLKVVK